MFCPLAGVIPPELGNLAALHTRSLQNNKLTGEFIPSESYSTEFPIFLEHLRRSCLTNM